ncbi:MAG: hypothetical protein FWF95_05670 [Syntrophorhabdaceae bacterium]|nr:hypothetical protein [Syntrophorhabdaceae bacterium]
MNIHAVIKKLCEKRPVFHSEADFQFALAWEIKSLYQLAEVRLEYPYMVPDKSIQYIDIFVQLEGHAYPIELKYKTKKLEEPFCWKNEKFNLKNHGAQNFNRYDFIKDIRRIEAFAEQPGNFRFGYAVWLTNDPSYWDRPKDENVGYASFSVHDGAVKTGTMKWGKGTGKGRKKELTLKNKYTIEWKKYHDLGVPNGLLKYAVVKVSI